MRMASVAKRPKTQYKTNMKSNDLITVDPDICLTWAIFFSLLQGFALRLLNVAAHEFLFLQKQFPPGDAVGVAEERRHRQFLRRARDAEQLEAGLVREAVGLALVHVLRGPDEVFPRVRATARAGHDVVEAAFVRVQQAARVLAAVAVALADGAGAELRALLRHTRIVHRDNDGRHADRAARGAHGVVAGANRQRDPFVPHDGAECFRTGTIAKFDVER